MRVFNHKTKRAQQDRKFIKDERGFSLVELVISLGVIGIVFFGIYKLMSEVNNQITDQAVAGQMQQVIKAAQDFVTQNYPEVQAVFTGAGSALCGGGACTTFNNAGGEQVWALGVDPNTTVNANNRTAFQVLQNRGYLSTAFQPINAFGQEYVVHFRALDPAANQIEVLVAALDPIGAAARRLDDRRGGRIATMIGGDGGFVYSDELSGGVVQASGAFGGWVVDPDDFQAAAANAEPLEGNLTSLTYFNGGTVVNNFIHRYRVPGFLQANRMFTTIMWDQTFRYDGSNDDCTEATIGANPADPNQLTSLCNVGRTVFIQDTTNNTIGHAPANGDVAAEDAADAFNNLEMNANSMHDLRNILEPYGSQYVGRHAGANLVPGNALEEAPDLDFGNIYAGDNVRVGNNLTAGEKAESTVDAAGLDAGPGHVYGLADIRAGENMSAGINAENNVEDAGDTDAGHVYATNDIRAGENVTAGIGAETSGVGPKELADTPDGNVFATADIRASENVTAGNGAEGALGPKDAADVPAAGHMYAMADIRATENVTAGNGAEGSVREATDAPAAGHMYATADIRAGQNVSAGPLAESTAQEATDTDGNVYALENVRAIQNVSAGALAQSTVKQAADLIGNVFATSNVRAQLDVTAGTAAQIPTIAVPAALGGGNVYATASIRAGQNVTAGIGAEVTVADPLDLDNGNIYASANIRAVENVTAGLLAEVTAAQVLDSTGNVYATANVRAVTDVSAVQDVIAIQNFLAGGFETITAKSMIEGGNGDVHIAMRTATGYGSQSSAVYMNGATGDVQAVGDMTAKAFFHSSDARFKDNVETVSDALDTLLKLRGVSFDWKSDGSRDYGFIAQEVEEILPELVKTDERGYKSVQYAHMMGLVVEALRELKQENADLKAELASFKHIIDKRSHIQPIKYAK